jgi:hypothetical protein
MALSLHGFANALPARCFPLACCTTASCSASSGRGRPALTSARAVPLPHFPESWDDDVNVQIGVFKRCYLDNPEGFLITNDFKLWDTRKMIIAAHT